MDTTQTTTPEQAHKNVGPIIATLVIILVLIIGALYIFASRINQQAIPSDAETTTTTVTTITNKSDDVKSLQSDLNTSASGLNGQGI